MSMQRLTIVASLLLVASLCARPAAAAEPCILICPANIIVDSLPYGGPVPVSFPGPTGTSLCGTVLQTSGLPSGSLFPVGTTTNAFSAAGGSTCSFDVTVNRVAGALEIPALSGRGLTALALLLGVAAAFVLRRRRAADASR